MLVKSWLCPLLVYEQDKAAGWKVRLCIPKCRWREPAEEFNVFNTTSLICSLAAPAVPDRWSLHGGWTETPTPTPKLAAFQKTLKHFKKPAKKTSCHIFFLCIYVGKLPEGCRYSSDEVQWLFPWNCFLSTSTILIIDIMCYIQRIKNQKFLYLNFENLLCLFINH